MNRSTRTSFVYFDLGNVLLSFDHDIACSNLAKLCQRDGEAIRQVVFDSDLQEKYEGGRISTSEFYDEFCQSLDVRVELNELCLAASAIFDPIYSMLPIVSQLYLSGIPLGILSNTCDAHWDYVFDGKYCFLNHFFSVYALSFELGSAKPDEEIYLKAIDLAGAHPNEIFFVDDKPENVEAAVAAGMDAVLFKGSLELTKELMGRGLLATI